MVEHCSANGEATGSNPVEAPKSFFWLISQLLKLRYNCDDHIFLPFIILKPFSRTGCSVANARNLIISLVILTIELDI